MLNKCNFSLRSWLEFFADGRYFYLLRVHQGLRIQNLNIRKLNKKQTTESITTCYLLDGSYINRKLSSLTPESVSQGKVCLMLLYLITESSRSQTTGSVKQKGQGHWPVLNRKDVLLKNININSVPFSLFKIITCLL